MTVDQPLVSIDSGSGIRTFASNGMLHMFWFAPQVVAYDLQWSRSRGWSPLHILQNTDIHNDCHHAVGINSRCQRNTMCYVDGGLSAAVPGGCHFAFHKILTPLLAAANGCMHGLGFADVRKRLSLEAGDGFPWLQPVVAAIRCDSVLRNAKKAA